MITITWDESGYETRSPDPTDDWDRGDTRTEVSNFKAVYSDEPAPEYSGWGNSERVDIDAQPGDIVFATIVQYSTGNTFGHDAGGRTEVLGVFKDAATAKRLELRAQNFEHDCKKSSDPYAQFQMDFEGTMIHVGWTGYFEHLDRVWVETLTVSA